MLRGAALLVVPCPRLGEGDGFEQLSRRTKSSSIIIIMELVSQRTNERMYVYSKHFSYYYHGGMLCLTAEVLADWVQVLH